MDFKQIAQWLNTGDGYAQSRLRRAAEKVARHCHDEEQRCIHGPAEDLTPFQAPPDEDLRNLRYRFLEAEALQQCHEVANMAAYRLDFVIYARVFLLLFYRSVVFAAACVILWPYLQSAIDIASRIAGHPL